MIKKRSDAVKALVFEHEYIWYGIPSRTADI